MTAALALASPIAVGQVRLSARQQAPAFAAARPSIFRNGADMRLSTVTNSIGGGGEKRKVLRREDEPEEYWTSEAERQGKSPFQDPLALIGILAILGPFLILGVAIATGLVDLSAGR